MSSRALHARAVALQEQRRSSALTLLRSLVAAGIVVSGLTAAGGWIVAASFGARSALHMHSPMQLEKRVALAGPYGAIANLGREELADGLVPPRRPALPTLSTLDPALSARSIIHGVPFAPVIPFALAIPQPAPVPPPVVADAGPRREVAHLAVPPATLRPQARPETLPLPDADNHTAIYDIAAHTVYLPNGQRLEAHSGLGEKMDDPRYVNVRMRGPTPPNVYNLTLRESLFHGVRAIRLTPAGDGNMFGRDGILAHTYMLGPNGQSNGCVSFDDYSAFLHAFLRGDVTRMVVVAHLPRPPVTRTASTSARNGSRYAAAAEY